MYICQSQSPSSLPHVSPSWFPSVGSLHLSISVLQIRSSTPFCRFHIYALIYNVCFWISWHAPWKMVGLEAGQTWSQWAEEAGFWQNVGPAQAQRGSSSRPRVACRTPGQDWNLKGFRQESSHRKEGSQPGHDIHQLRSSLGWEICFPKQTMSGHDYITNLETLFRFVKWTKEWLSSQNPLGLIHHG